MTDKGEESTISRWSHGPGYRKKRYWPLASLILLVVGVAGCGSSSPEERPAVAEGPIIPRFRDQPVVAKRLKIRPVHWRISEVQGSNEVQIYSSEGYCEGEPPPQYAGYRLRENKAKLYITVYVAELRSPSRSGEELCRGAGYTQTGKIMLARNVEDVELYDATTSPPSLRWPRSD